MTIPVLRAAGTVAVNTTGTITPGLPPGHVTNDTILLLCENAGAAISTPSGYAALADSPVLPGPSEQSGSTQLTAFWKRDGGSETAPNVTVAGNHTSCILLAFSGCILSGNPWDVTVAWPDGTSSTSVSLIGDTTTVADCLVVAACAVATDSTVAQFSAWANAGLSNVAEVANYCSQQGNGGGIGVATGGKAAAGAFGATTATLATSSITAGLVIALKPLVVAGGDSVGFITS